MDDSFLTDLSWASEIMGTRGAVNTIIADMGGMSQDEFEGEFRASLPVSSFTYTEDVIDGIATMMEGLLAMFFIFIGFGVLAELLFVSTTVVLNILDREMEFISLRAMGAKPGKIRRMVVGESMLILIPGLAVGLPLGRLSTRWIMAYVVQDLMHYDMIIGYRTYVLTALIAVISTYLAAYISARNITRRGLADTIRQRIIT